MNRAEVEKFVGFVKEDLEKKYGQKVAYAKDCQILANQIVQSTGRRISVSTMKRFFGVVRTLFNPSKFTLDTLSIYLGYDDWMAYIGSVGSMPYNSSKKSAWEQFRDRIHLITSFSLKSMETSLGKKAKKLPLRQFASEKVEAFLNSDKTALAFVAPSGYGKSNMVLQLVEKYFLGASALFPKDIVCLIDGNILLNLIFKNAEVNKIYNLLDFNPHESFSLFFREHPQEVNGRFVLIIDGIQEIYSQSVKKSQFIENLLRIISSYEGISWFKLVVTCHAESWMIFRHFMKRNLFLKNQWFDIERLDSEEVLSNIPPLSSSEIAEVLVSSQVDRELKQLDLCCPGVVDLISHPYFLHLFIEVQDGVSKVTEVDLLGVFVQKKILSDPFAEDKVTIIDELLRLCDYASASRFVHRNKLTCADDNIIAYEDLLKTGILHEYKVPGSYLSIDSYVRFSHGILLDFFLANNWIKSHELNIDLLRKVVSYYDDNPETQINVLKYIIKIAFKEAKIELLKNIYMLFQHPKSGALLLPLIKQLSGVIDLVMVSLRRNKRVRELLVPFYAQSRIGQMLYFEEFFDMDCLVLHSGANLDYYLQNVTVTRKRAYASFLKLLHFFLSEEPQRCREQYSELLKLKRQDDFDVFGLGYLVNGEILLHIIDGKLELKAVFSKIMEVASFLLDEGKQFVNGMPYFELSVIFSLNMGGYFNEIQALSSWIEKKYGLLTQNGSFLIQLYKAVCARVQLNLGKTLSANRLFDQVLVENIPSCMRYYTVIRYNLIKAEFLLFNGKKDVACELLNETVSFSKLLGFVYFQAEAIRLSKKCQG